MKRKNKYESEFDEYAAELGAGSQKKSKSFVRKVTAIVVAVIILAIAGLACWVVFYKPSAGNVTDLPFDYVADDTDEEGNPTGGITSVKHENSYNFLVMGHDRAANLTDVIMLVNYNMDTSSITILQMPRDTYIEIDGEVKKINSLYSGFYSESVKEGSKTPEKDAARDVATVLEKSMCVSIKYTAVMDLDGFGSIVDAIGGVDMYVPYRMYYNDPVQNLHIDLYEGQQVLDGDKAEQFVRFRSGYVQADIARGNAQKMFMAAFINQLKNSISITNVSMISNLASTVADNVYTDISVTDIVSFAKNALSVDLSNINMITLPGNSKTCDGQSYYIGNRASMLRIVNESYNIYDADITEAMFDKDRIFTNENDEGVNGIYLATDDEILDYEYNAQDVVDNPIDIGLK
jgi:LCP family protein required for cell wall assembly